MGSNTNVITTALNTAATAIVRNGETFATAAKIGRAYSEPST